MAEEYDMGAYLSRYVDVGFAMPLERCTWGIGTTQTLLHGWELRLYLRPDDILRFPAGRYITRPAVCVNLDHVYVRCARPHHVKQVTDTVLEVMQAWHTTQAMFDIDELIVTYVIERERTYFGRKLNKETFEWEES